MTIEAKLLLYKFLRENPSFATELFTGVKLFPFQHMAIKAMMESDYFLGHMEPRNVQKLLYGHFRALRRYSTSRGADRYII